jgi:hypothetical protein
MNGDGLPKIVECPPGTDGMEHLCNNSYLNTDVFLALNISLM